MHLLVVQSTLNKSLKPFILEAMQLGVDPNQPNDTHCTPIALALEQAEKFTQPELYDILDYWLSKGPLFNEGFR